MVHGGAHQGLRALRDRPFELLFQLEQQMSASRQTGADEGEATWNGLGFRLGEQWFVVPQREIREVVTPLPYSRVPNAKSWLLGVANVRGSLLPLIDTSMLLFGRRTVVQRPSRFLSLNIDELPLGFLVDAVTGYRRFLPDEQRHDLRKECAPELQPYLLGAFVRDNQVWPALSLVRLAVAESSQNANA